MVIGVGPALILSYLEHGSLPRLGGVLAPFAATQLLEGNVLSPKLLGSRVGLHPVVVLLGVLAGSHYFGFLGIMLAVPILAAGRGLLSKHGPTLSFDRVLQSPQRRRI